MMSIFTNKVWKKAQWGQSTLLHFDNFEVFCVQPHEKKPSLAEIVKSKVILNEMNFSFQKW